MKPVHITLTTIPPRADDISLTLRSLLDQHAKIEAVHLFLPKKYRRKDFNGYRIPKVPKGVELHIVEDDLGPATKILPALELLSDKSTPIIFCDDDKIYDPTWAQRYLECKQQHQNAVICESSLDVRTLEARAYRATHPALYRIRRVASFGTWKPTKNYHSDKNLIFEGVGGVLVEPRFFTDDVYDIPDILWTVDDVWLSGHVTKNGIEIKHNREISTKPPLPTSNAKKFALNKMVYKDHNRYAADMACVEYYRKNHGIWLTDPV